VKECGAFANINAKGIGRPPPKGLDAVIGPPAGSEESGTAGAEGVATEGKGEEGVKPGEVPGTGGDSAAGVEPKKRAKTVTAVATTQIIAENQKGVKRGRSCARDDDDIAFKKSVGFVGWEVIRQDVSRTGNRGAENALARRAKRRVVVVNELSQAVKREEATKSKCEEKKVIVRGGGKGAREPEKMIGGEGKLAGGR
jgi:hypothetical protein